MLNILKAEFYKTKNTCFFWVHLILPLGYASLVYASVLVTGIKRFLPAEIIQNYLVILGGCLPIVIGVITAKNIELEASAGQFFALLASTNTRAKIYLGKYLFLLSSAAGAIFLALFSFAILFCQQSLATWLNEAVLLLLGCAPVYLLHLGVSFKLGGNASIWLGFVEMLVAFLFMTSLGDKLWYYLPSAWPARLEALYVLKEFQANKVAYVESEMLKWSVIAVTFWAIGLILSLYWFSKWDGKTYLE